MEECFSRFLNCTDGTKSRNASHILTDLLIGELHIVHSMTI